MGLHPNHGSGPVRRRWYAWKWYARNWNLHLALRDINFCNGQSHESPPHTEVHSQGRQSASIDEQIAALMRGFHRMVGHMPQLPPSRAELMQPLTVGHRNADFHDWTHP